MEITCEIERKVNPFGVVSAFYHAAPRLVTTARVSRICASRVCSGHEKAVRMKQRSKKWRSVWGRGGKQICHPCATSIHILFVYIMYINHAAGIGLSFCILICGRWGWGWGWGGHKLELMCQQGRVLLFHGFTIFHGKW